MVLMNSNIVSNENKFNFDEEAATNTTCDFKRLKPRLVKKCGELNIIAKRVPKKRQRLLSDLFNTVLDIKWRYHFLIFSLSFIISWFFFASIWYLIAYLNNDLGNNNIDIGNNTNLTNEKIRCVAGVHDFTSALLMSIETQHTIGYGLRHVTEQCKGAIIFLMLQSCIGILVQGLVAGVVFSKLSRPNKRKKTIIFSHNAVITERDRKICFLFKIGNIKISQLSGARIKIIMIKSRLTQEGEYIPFENFDCKVRKDTTTFFPYPVIIEHIIDESSPFHKILNANNAVNNENDDYEIIVILEGNIETTGSSCHIRTSYLAHEVLWGYRFTPSAPIVTKNGYLFDFSKFNKVEIVDKNLSLLNRKH